MDRIKYIRNVKKIAYNEKSKADFLKFQNKNLRLIYDRNTFRIDGVSSRSILDDTYTVIDLNNYDEHNQKLLNRFCLTKDLYVEVHTFKGLKFHRLLFSKNYIRSDEPSYINTIILDNLGYKFWYFKKYNYDILNSYVNYYINQDDMMNDWFNSNSEDYFPFSDVVSDLPW